MFSSEPLALDVYLTAREFASWGGKAFKMLPAPLKESIIDVGVCHYMVLVKAPDGRVLQLDFGPRGGRDVHVSMPGTCMAMAALSNTQRVMPTEPLELDSGGHAAPCQLSQPEPGVPGEVRQRWLEGLPSHTPVVHVGTTSMSSEQILEFSRQQPTYYLLHDNDCRHYANKLVHRMTGVHRATAVFVRQQYQEKVSRSPQSHPYRPLVEALQALTDYTNWDSIKGATNMAAAALTPFLGLNLLRGVRAVPVRLTAGFKATRVITNMVRSKAGVAVVSMARSQAGAAATITRRAAVASTPAAVVAAASLAAAARGGQASQPWEEQRFQMALVPVLAVSKATSAAPAVHMAGAPPVGQHDSAVARAPARVSQAMTAALATYATSYSSSQPLVHLLGQHMKSLPGAVSKVAVGISGMGRATAESILRAAARSRTAPAAPGALTVRQALTGNPIMFGPGPNAPGPLLSARGSQSMSMAPASSHQGCRAVMSPKALSAAHFFSRGGAASKALLLSTALAYKASKECCCCTQSRGADAITAACSMTAMLQQQAIKWQLIG